MTSLPSSPASVRIDAWLWAVRAYKTRSAATAACRAGHIRLNGSPAKASATLVTGDTVTVRMSGYERILEVRRLINKRRYNNAPQRTATDTTSIV